MSEQNTPAPRGFLERMTGSTGGLGVFKFILLVLGALSLIQLAYFVVIMLYIMLTVHQMDQIRDLSALIQALGRLG